MDLGKRIRLSKIFSHPSGRLCSVAVDHYAGYTKHLPHGLTDLPKTIAALVKGQPDAITMNKGVAKNCWGPHAGKTALIVQAGCFRVDDSIIEVLTEPEEVVRLGGDAIAVAIGLSSKNEGMFIKMLAEKVTQAARFDLPVIAHIYPRDFSGEPRIVHDPDSIAWAVRTGIECGVDVIKVGYTGDKESWSQIVDGCPVPIVCAGGPKADTLAAALEQIADSIDAGSLGATVGRNIWGAANITGALNAYKAVIHDRTPVAEAIKYAA